jgi:uncharacterized protein DUF6876
MQSDTQGKKTLDATDLAQFTGAEQWYRHSINRKVLYTDGAQYVAEHGGAYWLLDEIALIQPYDKKSRCRRIPSLDTQCSYRQDSDSHLR